MKKWEPTSCDSRAPHPSAFLPLHRCNLMYSWHPLIDICLCQLTDGPWHRGNICFCSLLCHYHLGHCLACRMHLLNISGVHLWIKESRWEKREIPNILIICGNPVLNMSLQVPQDQDLEVANICCLKRRRKRFPEDAPATDLPFSNSFPPEKRIQVSE